MERALRGVRMLTTATQSTKGLRAMFPSMPTKVKIVEVAPRDGLQNEKEILSTSELLLLARPLHVPIVAFPACRARVRGVAVDFASLRMCSAWCMSNTGRRCPSIPLLGFESSTPPLGPTPALPTPFLPFLSSRAVPPHARRQG